MDKKEQARYILASARRDLGHDLYGLSPVDLLLDNMNSLTIEEARRLLAEIDHA